MTYLAVLTLCCAVDHGAPVQAQSSRTEISPIEVTARKLPEMDFGELHEIRRRSVEAQLLPQRIAAKSELTKHRSNWTEANILNYRMTVTQIGAWSYRSSMVVIVRNGKVASAKYLTRPYAEVTWTPNQPKTEVPEEMHITIADLFAAIERLLEPADSLPIVTYDSQYSFPTCIANNHWDTSDDDSEICIRGFEVLQ